MKRDLEALAQAHYDILVVGGGIYGACVARDAALRGLSVALLEKDDFGHATSANSLKIMHGGLRYLQNGSLRLMRTMTRERKAWLRIAPHLVHPLPCLMPTTRKISRSRTLMALGLSINDWVAYDRNRGMDTGQQIPGGRLLGRDEFLHRLPGLPADRITGGVLWYDAQVSNTERLLLAILASAAAAGARVANYVEVTGFLRSGNKVRGVAAVDAASGRALEVRARLVVLCAGAWTGPLLDELGVRQPAPALRPSLAINLVTRQLCSDHALALPTEAAPGPSQSVRAPRTLLIVPWQQHSIVGTLHLPCATGQVPCSAVTEDALAGFLAAINMAYPEAQLSLADVRHVHAGFLPAFDGNGHGGEVRLLRKSQIADYQRLEGIAGLVAVKGVKYTTARHTAEQVVDLALQKLQRDAQPCVTDQLPVAGGDTGDFATYLARAEQEASPLVGTEMIRHLVANYGSGYGRILAFARQNPDWSRPLSVQPAVLAAEIVHAVRDEMAVRLADVVQRRTILGAAGPPGATAVEACAALMGDLIGWSARQRQDEIEQLYAGYRRRAPAVSQPAIA
jgi:glycerol-3-phosphate dehydrogenase